MRELKRKSILFTSSALHVTGGEINLLALLDTIDTMKFASYCLYQPLSHFETYGLKQNTTLIPFFPLKYVPKNLFEIIGALIQLFFLVIKNKIDLIYINIIADYKLVRFVSKIECHIRKLLKRKVKQHISQITS